jgi:hypothetical protein
MSIISKKHFLQAAKPHCLRGGERGEVALAPPPSLGLPQSYLCSVTGQSKALVRDNMCRITGSNVRSQSTLAPCRAYSVFALRCTVLHVTILCTPNELACMPKHIFPLNNALVASLSIG